MPDKSVDAVITDPPYRTLLSGKSTINKPLMKKLADEKWQLPGNEWVIEIERVMKIGATYYIFCGFEDISFLKHNLRASGLRTLNNLVWIKSNPIPSFTKKVYRNSSEVAIFGSKQKTNYFRDRKQQELLGVYYEPVVSGADRTEHPTQKPLSIIKEWVLDTSQEGDTILDPFMGSGTTGVACVQTGRNFIGCEIDPGYYAIAEKRIKDAQQQIRMEI
ncbi:MAG: site-specific DNA-methyltransferase [Methanoregula sp.]|jgi:DNA modification methylase|nr:site-specific DNA-methyltransferase [Methanoregula sp.]